jgi:hypothetical protein
VPHPSHFLRTGIVWHLPDVLRSFILRRHIVSTTFSLLILISANAQAPSLDSATEHIQSVIAGSKRVRRILSDVKAGTKYRISFVALNPAPDKPYQGYSTTGEGDDKNGITIHITPGLSDQLTETLVAHELFHIVLLKQGWPTQGKHLFLPKEIDKTQKHDEVLKDAEMGLMSCYPDALIDKWMLARGFEPSSLNRREYELTIQQAAKETETFPLYFRNYVALINYCLSIRARDFQMEDIFNAYQQADPSMKKQQASLEQQLGKSIKCNDVSSCLEATKALRRAAGFQAQIYFLNRLTDTWQ